MKSKLVYRFLRSCALMGSVFLSATVTAGELLGPEGGDGWSIWYEEVSSDNLPWLMDMQCAYFSKQSADGSYYEFKRQLGYSSSIVPPDSIPGYQFKQWLVLRTLADREDYAVHLYAQWEKVPEARKIHFNVNDEFFQKGVGAGILNSRVYPASGTMDDLEYTLGEDVVLPSNEFKRKGFDFGGWATAPNFTAAYADEAVIKAKDLPTGEGGLELFAVWNAKTIKVAFDFQGLAGWSNDTKTYLVGLTYSSGGWHYVSSTDCNVDGWFTREGDEVGGDDYVSTENTTLYLHWNYKNGDGGGAGVKDPFDGNGKHVFNGLVRDVNNEPCGLIQVTTAKATAKGVKVSGFVMLEDGKKVTMKAVTVAVEKKQLNVSTTVGKLGSISLTIGGNGFAGTLGDMKVASEKVGEDTGILKATVKMSYFEGGTGKLKSRSVKLTGITVDGAAAGTLTTKGRAAKEFVAEIK